MIFAIKRVAYPDDQEEIQRFKREVKIQASLIHENIVPVIDQYLERDPPEFVMPRAEFNLKAFLNRFGTCPENIVIFNQIAEGLKFAHSNGIIHRDLKPENILCFYDPSTDTHRFAICDFGLGRDLRSKSPNITISGMVLGTYEYIAPEQYLHPKMASISSDIYSLGKILYEILTAETPYPDIDLNKIPPEFKYIIQKACDRKPELRYQCVDDLQKAVNLVTSETKKILNPVFVVTKEIEEINSKGDFSKERIEKLMILLTEYQENRELLIQKFPVLPDHILSIILEDFQGAFLNILKEYDNNISGGLDFSYCDVVADFYKKIYNMTDSFEIRKIILTRLPSLGRTNNRYYVGKVFAELVSQTTDPSLILTIKEVLESNTGIARWNQEYLEHANIPIVIKEIFQ